MFLEVRKVVLVTPPSKGPLDTLRDRALRLLGVCAILAAVFVLFFQVMYPLGWKAAAFVPLLCHYCWQGISRLIRGRGFSYVVVTAPKSVEELWSVLFSVAFAFNTLVFVYLLLE